MTQNNMVIEESQDRPDFGGPLEIYDVTIDETRAVTQRDVDQLILVGSTQSLLRRAIRHLDEMAGMVIRHEISRDGFHAMMRKIGVN